MLKRNTCRLCNSPIDSGEITLNAEVCQLCDIAIFQLDCILEEYTRGSGRAPDMIQKAMQHFCWLFDSYPLAAAYLNIAMEVLYYFIIDEETVLKVKELEGLDFISKDPNKVLDVLRKAYLIEQYTVNEIQMGQLTKKLSQLHLANYNLRSDEFVQKVNEIRGVLCFALTRAMLKDSYFTPQRPLSPLRALGLHILHNTSLEGPKVDEAIPREMDEDTFEYGCKCISDRAFRKMKFYMAGFVTGRPYLIDDVRGSDKHEVLILNDAIVDYLEYTRDRYRERLREREHIRK